jgi:hypothetical protein
MVGLSYSKPTNNRWFHRFSHVENGKTGEEDGEAEQNEENTLPAKISNDSTANKWSHYRTKERHHAMICVSQDHQALAIVLPVQCHGVSAVLWSEQVAVGCISKRLPFQEQCIPDCPSSSCHGRRPQGPSQKAKNQHHGSIDSEPTP